MRIFLLSLAVIGGLTSLSGCSSTGNNAAAVDMMDNPVNACGTDGSSNANDCASGRR